MDAANDTRIEAFRQTVERIRIITAQLQTLAVNLARAKELPGLISRASSPIERQHLSEEQAVIGHPLGLQIRRSQLESELRQGWVAAAEQLRAATDAASVQVTTAAGGTEAARALPFARRHLEELAKYRDLPATASPPVRLGFLRQAWMAIDAAMAAPGEIRFEARRGD